MDRLQKRLHEQAKSRGLKHTRYMSCKDLVKLLGLEKMKGRYYDECTEEEFNECLYLHSSYSSLKEKYEDTDSDSSE